MKKSLQILFGLLLILVLAYIAFLDVSTKIKDDLLRKTKVMLSKNNLKDVTGKIQGEGLGMSRTLVLTGTAISDVERVRIITLAENIEGFCHVNNQITLYPVVPMAPVVPSVPTAIKASSSKTTPKELVVTKSVNKELEENKTIKKVPTISVVENKKSTTVVSARKTTVVPIVPTVESKRIVVPIPVNAIDAPKVIKVEKIKLEGVK